MQREDVISILSKVSIDDVSKTILSLRGLASITMDQVARIEDGYLVLRGREAGTNDEGRGFFVPFDDIQFIKIDRVMMVEEMKRMYGEKVADIKRATDVEVPSRDASQATIETPAPVMPMDPAAIAKQNLLARIRAARNAVTGA